jgi:23S rRNA maturation-related 3'-5' exoribonuclease YhaM
MSNPTITELPDRLSALRRTAETLGCVDLASKVLDDKNFRIWSGSHHRRAHHYGDGGLLTHTFEVVTLSLNTAHLYSDIHKIDYKQLFLSALYHDYGKLWDYDRGEDGEWVTRNHRRKIHHISRSNVEWVRWAIAMGADDELIDAVSHNILSHHGSRECGSPVAPYTREAWILHLSDSMSARVDDCDRLDLVKINKNA